MEKKFFGVLENVTMEEMELAIQTIQKKREEDASRVARIKELEKEMNDIIREIYSLNGKVVIGGGKYIPCDSKVNISPQTMILVRY